MDTEVEEEEEGVGKAEGRVAVEEEVGEKESWEEGEEMEDTVGKGVSVLTEETEALEVRVG